jgi:hypothetical protein
MPVETGETCGDYPVHFLHEPRVHRTPGIPCALLSIEGQRFHVHPGRSRVSGSRKHVRLFEIWIGSSSTDIVTH